MLFAITQTAEREYPMAWRWKTINLDSRRDRESKAKMSDKTIKRGTTNHELQTQARQSSTKSAVWGRGRPYLYGLAVNGAEGVNQVINILRDEFQMAMALTGRANIASIDCTVLWT
jgi:hypothetical protein